MTLTRVAFAALSAVAALVGVSACSSAAPSAASPRGPATNAAAPQLTVTAKPTQLNESASPPTASAPAASPPAISDNASGAYDETRSAEAPARRWFDSAIKRAGWDLGGGDHDCCGSYTQSGTWRGDEYGISAHPVKMKLPAPAPVARSEQYMGTRITFYERDDDGWHAATFSCASHVLSVSSRSASDAELAMAARGVRAELSCG